MSEIIKTRPGDTNFNLFEDFPKEIYPEDSPYYQQLSHINETYLENCFLLLENGNVKCRASMYCNPYMYYQNKKTVTIGHYESFDDKNNSKKLISHIVSEAKKLKAEFLIGPMNGSTWDEYRFSLNHQYPTFFLEPYHQLYYNQHFLNADFEIIAKYYSSLETDLIFNSPFVLERENELRKIGVNFRNINLEEFEKELEKIYEFNSVSFKSNFLFTPIKIEDFLKKYTETKKFINPQFVMLAEDKEENLIGYFFCIRDFYNKNSKTLIAKTVARHPDKAWSGVGHVLGNIIAARALKEGYQAIIHPFMHEEGTSKKMSDNFSGKSYKNYVLYGRSI